MIGRVHNAIRACFARRRADRRALDSYRANVPYLRARLSAMPDICAVLDQVASNAGDGADAYVHITDLRDKVLALRAEHFRASHEKTLRDALMHLRLLAREIDGVSEQWADERLRRTLSGGSVTLGEFRAAKAFINRIDGERIKAHETKEVAQ